MFSHKNKILPSIASYLREETTNDFSSKQIPRLLVYFILGNQKEFLQPRCTGSYRGVSRNNQSHKQDHFLVILRTRSTYQTFIYPRWTNQRVAPNSRVLSQPSRETTIILQNIYFCRNTIRKTIHNQTGGYSWKFGTYARIIRHTDGKRVVCISQFIANA